MKDEGKSLGVSLTSCTMGTGCCGEERAAWRAGASYRVEIGDD